jgi:endoglucanase
MKRAIIFLCCIFSFLITLAQAPQWVSSNKDNTDTIATLPVISIENAVVTEGDNGGCYMVLLLSLNKRSKDPVKVQYQTASSTANETEDYLQKRGVIIFPSNRLLQTVRIQVDCDVHSKLDKTFIVKLSGAVNAVADHMTTIGTINPVIPIQSVSMNKAF